MKPLIQAMTPQLFLDLAIVDVARRSGASPAEVYTVRTKGTPVRFEANRLKGAERPCRSTGVQCVRETQFLGGTKIG